MPNNREFQAFCDFDQIRNPRLEPGQKIVPLDEIENGESVLVVSFAMGRRALTRLCHLGITPGIRITKIFGAPFHGPIKLKVRDTTLAIGRGLACKILVARDQGR